MRNGFSGISFVLHIWTDIKKFLRGDTTMTSAIEQQNEIPYPIITICPTDPFNYSAMQELGLHPNFWATEKMNEEHFKLPGTIFFVFTSLQP